MNALMLELPVDALASPGVSLESLAIEAKFMLALKLFEVGRLSSAKAGQLCGMGRVEFLLAASRAGVPVLALDSDELDAELVPND
jgi:predicted HTH domain antitoxin